MRYRGYIERIVSDEGTEGEASAWDVSARLRNVSR